MHATAPPRRARRFEPADLLEDIAVAAMLASAAVAAFVILALILFV